jgi:hypothetical protein
VEGKDLSVTLRFALVLGVAVAGLAGGTMWWGARADDSQLNLDAVFRCTATDAAGKQTCAEGRELILQSCTACPTFVRIARAQKTEAQWDATLSVHRLRTVNLSDEQFARVRQYLVSHFNPEHPQPAVPPELLKLGNNLRSPAAGPL